MKNLSLGLIFTLVLLPQVSFGANSPATFVNPAVTACEQQLNPNAFFAHQAYERGVFIKSNPNSMAAHDQHFRAMLAIDMAKRTGKSTAGFSTPPAEDPTFATFQAKQQSDKANFLAKLAQLNQNCQSSSGSYSLPSSTGNSTGN